MISPNVKEERKRVLSALTELKAKITAYEKEIKISPSLVSDVKVINDDIDTIDTTITELKKWKTTLKTEAEKFIGYLQQGKKSTKKIRKSTKSTKKKSSVQTQKDEDFLEGLQNEITRLRKNKYK